MSPRKANSSKKVASPTSNGATVGYEAELWRMADALRGSMDAAEYKHVVLGLIFLKYISGNGQRGRLASNPLRKVCSFSQLLIATIDEEI